MGVYYGIFSCYKMSVALPSQEGALTAPPYIIVGDMGALPSQEGAPRPLPLRGAVTCNSRHVQLHLVDQATHFADAENVSCSHSHPVACYVRILCAQASLALQVPTVQRAKGTPTSYTSTQYETPGDPQADLHSFSIESIGYQP